MSQKPSIINPRATVPPDGFWRFRIGDTSVESPVYDIAVRRVAEVLAANGIKDDAEDALARYMCPRLPAWMCSGGSVETQEVLAGDAERRAKEYFYRQVEPVDVITRRMEACMRCKRHRRDFCLHCQGYDTWIYDRFGGRRPRLPADDASGCCTCAGTFEAVIASVEYTDKDKIWEGAPENCWRFQR